uniref:Putative sulfite reductase-associated electron transfer protein DsrO n=1 Tax=Chlorobium chlorochromatii (strain CaD3) TaxID=340177 RepID=Q3AP82_CHLCH
MNEQRREFIRLAGMGFLASVGATCGLMSSAPLEATDLTVFADSGNGAVRWGMLVDTRKCREGCNKCIESCHTVHNVPDFASAKERVQWIEKRPVASLFSERKALPAQSATLPALCNHCAKAPCVTACPTSAIFRRYDGIVGLDFHRCIGCRACMTACPYSAISFNWKAPRPAIKSLSDGYPTREQGMVEKCNFCSERLAKGLMPACAESCPEHALVFGNLNDPASEIRTLLASSRTLQRKAEQGTKPSVFYII